MKEYKRILLVDDNKDIHEDFHKILDATDTQDIHLTDLEGILFDDHNSPGKTRKEMEKNLNFQLDDAYQGDEALLKVEKAEKENDPYVLIFMDVRMPPGMDGIETIYRIWRKYPIIEIVICSAFSDYSWDEIVNRLGVTDKLLFLKKPFNSLELKQLTFSLVKKWNLNYQVNCLVNKLEGEIKARSTQLDHLLIELREKNQKLAELSRKDSLTGLLNHVSLYEQLNALYSESRRHDYPLLVIMIDIDHFKAINEQFGYSTGDEILKSLSGVLLGSLRLYDVTLRYKDDGSETLKKEMERYELAGRYGGDEFILIIPHCGKEEAVTVVERIQAKLKALHFDAHPDFNLTVSIGVAVMEKEIRCAESDALIKLVDKALCLAKSHGGDQISYLFYE